MCAEFQSKTLGRSLTLGRSPNSFNQSGELSPKGMHGPAITGCFPTSFCYSTSSLSVFQASRGLAEITVRGRMCYHGYALHSWLTRQARYSE